MRGRRRRRRGAIGGTHPPTEAPKDMARCARETSVAATPRLSRLDVRRAGWHPHAADETKSFFGLSRPSSRAGLYRAQLPAVLLIISDSLC